MNEKVSSFYPTALKCENMLLARKFYKKKKKMKFAVRDIMLNNKKYQKSTIF